MIVVSRLDIIGANAFREVSLQNLNRLRMIVYAPLTIHQNAFNGLESMKSLDIKSTLLDIPVGLFLPIAASIRELHISGWPNIINLNEMFAFEKYRLLLVLDLAHVIRPQWNFNLLAASNFTAFRRLRDLSLWKCGIEVIDEHAFDSINQTLTYLNLEENRISIIDVAMFRIFFETKSSVHFVFIQKRFRCTCRTVEVNIMFHALEPILDLGDCVAHIAECGVHRDVMVAKFDEKKTIMRIIKIRMIYGDRSILLWTNFTSRFRLLFVNADAMQHGKCIDKALVTNYKCLNVNNKIDQLAFHGIEVTHGAEYVSITAIPILYRFGARPMHSITVRSESHEHWPTDCTYLIAIIAMIAGIAIGLSLIVGMESLRTHSIDVGTAPKRHVPNSPLPYYSAADDREQYERAEIINTEAAGYLNVYSVDYSNIYQN